MFSQLNVRDETNTHSRLRHSSTGVGAALSSITVRPISAPLAAAVGPVVIMTKPPLVSLPTIPAPRSRLHPFPTPSPQCPSVTLIPTDHQIGHRTGQRKISSLPRRALRACYSDRQTTSPSSPGLQTDNLFSSPQRSVRSVSSERCLSSSGITTPEVFYSLSPDPPPFDALYSRLVELC